MKILAVSITFLFCFSMIASAIPNSVIAGPFKVSFDLGLNESDYKTNVTEPTQSEYLSGNEYTYWYIWINNYMVSIYIRQCESNVWTDHDWEKQIQDNTNIFYIQDHATRTIDNSVGGIAEVQPIREDKYYHAMFTVATDPHSYVSVISYYPWDEGTLQLLKTIHVERMT